MTAAQSALFRPLQIRGTILPNRIVLAPMMQCKAVDGFMSDWHLVHYGKFALGGFGTVLTEAVAVEPAGRITHGCPGIWSDTQVPMLRRIVDFVHSQGALAAIQLGHSGRKGSTHRPWESGYGPLKHEDALPGEAPWPLVGPVAKPVGEGYPVPHALSVSEIKSVVGKFGEAARRAEEAGFDIIEIHGAHGYLIASFLTPLVNERTDEYGASRDGRMRLALEVAREVRANWPTGKPLFFRVSAEDGGGPGGWGIEDSVALAVALGEAGVDVVDCSSGGLRTSAVLQNTARGPGFQVPYAERIRRDAAMATMAVGLILDGAQAEAILRDDKADLIAVGRQAMYDPYWGHHAAQSLGCDPRFGQWNESAGWWLDKRTGTLELAGFKPDGTLAVR